MRENAILTYSVWKFIWLSLMVELFSFTHILGGKHQEITRVFIWRLIQTYMSYKALFDI